MLPEDFEVDYKQLVKSLLIGWHMSGLDYFRRQAINVIENHALEHIELLSTGPNGDPVYTDNTCRDVTYFVPPVNPVGHYYTKTGEHFRCLPENEQ